MRTDWRNHEEAGYFIAQLNATRTVAADGRPAFTGAFEYDEIVLVLESLIKFTKAVAPYQRGRILRPALFVAARDEMTPDLVLGAIREKELAFLSTVPREFVFAAPLSIRTRRRVIRRFGKRATLTLCPGQDARYDRAPVLGYARTKDSWRWGTWVYVRQVARDAVEAGNLAQDALDTYRAIWNLALTKGQTRRSFGHRRHPANPIYMGAIRTVHEGDGGPALDTYWYDLSVDPDATLPDLTQRWPRMLRWERRIRNGLRGHPLREKLSRALRAYVRALDDSDYAAAFLRIWSLMEDLTGSGEAGRTQYDVLIRRTSALYKDHSHSGRVLQYLRRQRNELVHGEVHGDHGEQRVYMLKRYAEDLLLFLIDNPLGYAKHGEFCAFLDLPADPAVLERRSRLLKDALRFRNS